jgi:hypothetical protein
MKRTLLLAVAVPLAALPLLMGGTASAATPTTAAPPTAPQPPDPQTFLQCLRDHGVDVPDPQPGGGPVLIQAGPDDTAKLDALKTCGPDLPPPGQPGRRGEPATVQVGGGAELKPFADCMRDHGLADFPEPDDEGLVVQKDSDVHPGDATFDAAQDACKDLLPAPPAGAAAGGAPVAVGAGGAAGPGIAVAIAGPGTPGAPAIAAGGNVEVQVQSGGKKQG